MDSRAARFIDTPLSNEAWRTAFSGDFEHERMSRVRVAIADVRRQWATAPGYRRLVADVQRICRADALDAETQRQLCGLFQGFRDYADVDLRRPEPPPRDPQLAAIDLYCSGSGYLYISKVLQHIFRKDRPSRDELVRATVLVEWITIDLYNLRLSHIGDARFRNFEGSLYRWMKLEPRHLPEYHGILRRSDLAKRNFAIPLGFLSTSTDPDCTRSFAALAPDEVGSRTRVLHRVEVRGMDPGLLAAYRGLYPDSVVTSICAMPVASMSRFDEKEVLLRGPFFHLVALADRDDGDGPYVEMVSVSIQANRDHGSEYSSNQGDKARQRAAFLTAVNASKWQVCASVAAQFAPHDADGYRCLHDEVLLNLRQDFGLVPEPDDGRPAHHREAAVWLGARRKTSYPRHYADRRVAWQAALLRGDWRAAQQVLGHEYSWGRSQWYNVGRLFDDGEPLEGDSPILLHELVRHAPPTVDARDDNHRAWEELVDGASSGGVWKTLRSLDARGITAEELAQERGLDSLAERLKPTIMTPVDATVLASLEMRLRDLIKEKTAEFMDHEAFYFPQLSVLTEMDRAEMWIPIPRMYGGFLARLEAPALNVTIFETQMGLYQPVQTRLLLSSGQSS